MCFAPGTQRELSKKKWHAFCCSELCVTKWSASNALGFACKVLPFVHAPGLWQACVELWHVQCSVSGEMWIVPRTFPCVQPSRIPVRYWCPTDIHMQQVLSLSLSLRKKFWRPSLLWATQLDCLNCHHQHSIVYMESGTCGAATCRIFIVLWI